MKVVIEGIDGSGKTTLAQGLLALPFFTHYVHYPVNVDLSLEGIALQREMKRDMIENPAPDNSVIDRYWQSSYVYGMPSYMLRDLKRAIDTDTVNIFLNVSPGNALQRCLRRKGIASRWDMMTIQERANLRDRYLELDCWDLVIDANQSPRQVLMDTCTHLYS